MLPTLKYVKALKQAGISRAQVVAHVQLLTEIVEDSLATKQDIRDLKDEMQKMEYRLVKKLGAIVSLSLAAAATIVMVIVKTI